MFRGTGLADLSFLYPLDPLAFIKDGCKWAGSSLLYLMVFEGNGLLAPFIIYIYLLGWRGTGVVDLPILRPLGFTRGVFKETGSPLLYLLRFEGTRLADFAYLYPSDPPEFSRDRFGRTGASFLY